MTKLLESNIREDLKVAFRSSLEAQLYQATVDRTVAVDEPADGQEAPDLWTKLPVITRRQWSDILFRIFDAELPEPDETTAEVKTPSEILVWAFCPRCGVPAAIRVFLSPVLTIDSQGSQLKLKATSKATYHVCGQQILPATRNGHVADGQVEAFVETGIDSPTEGPTEDAASPD